MTPRVGMVVQLSDGRLFRIVAHVCHGPVQAAFLQFDDEIKALAAARNVELPRVVRFDDVWAVAPRKKTPGWSKTRHGWSRTCWDEMTERFAAEVVLDPWPEVKP